MEASNNKSLVISYLTLRIAVGVLGVTLPIILVLGSLIFREDEIFQRSISMYYYTHMRNALVGILCAVALFLFAYKGYDYRDNIAGHFAGFFALLVAFCPAEDSFIRIIHLVSAVLFFLTLAYFSLFLFTKGSASPSKQKLLRNKIYKICGFIILGCVVLLILYFVLPKSFTDRLSDYKPLFWLESLALWAFGCSWLIKGEFLFKDE